MNQSPNATKCLTLIASSSEDDEIIDKEKTKVKKCPNLVYCHEKTFDTFEEAHKFISDNGEDYYVTAQEGIGGDNINIQVIKKYDELMTKCNWVDFKTLKNCALGY